MVELTVREALRDAMAEEMRADGDVFLMGEEVAEYQGAYKVSQGLLEEFGARRVIDTPITEAGFAGIGIGAAMAGLKPVEEYANELGQETRDRRIREAFAKLASFNDTVERVRESRIRSDNLVVILEDVTGAVERLWDLAPGGDFLPGLTLDESEEPDEPDELEEMDGGPFGRN